MPSKMEAELKKVTKLTQAADEPRKEYLLRLLTAGQSVKPDLWATLSTAAQSWYNGAVNSYMTHTQPSDIPDFPDLPPVAPERARMAPAPMAAAEPGSEETGDPTDDEPPLEEEIDTSGEGVEAEAEQEAEAAPAPEPAPAPSAAAKPAPAPKPAGKPAPKPASSPKAAAAPATGKAAGNGKAASVPPKASPPRASTLIKRMLIKNLNVTNAELQERLRAEGINVTPISVSTIRSDFRHSLRVLQEAGYAKDIGPI